MSLTDSMERDVTGDNMSVLLIEKQTPRVTVLTLNRPDRRNSLTIELMTELVAAIEAAMAEDATARQAHADRFLATMSWDVTWEQMDALIDAAAVDRPLVPT